MRGLEFLGTYDHVRTFLCFSEELAHVHDSDLLVFAYDEHGNGMRAGTVRARDLREWIMEGTERSRLHQAVPTWSEWDRVFRVTAIGEDCFK